MTLSIWVMMALARYILANQRVELNGAGASFPAEVYSKWMAGYIEHRREHVDLRMKYDSVGTGSGKQWIKQNHSPYIAYAGSDTRLTPEEAVDFPDLKTIPTMAGSIVLGYNIPEVLNQGQILTLDSETIVGIYNGTINNWNSTLIQSLNQGVQLPDADIIVLARKDKSGTTAGFTEGLSSFSDEWNNAYGVFSKGVQQDGSHKYWNESVIAYFGLTNKGVAGMLMSMWYSIGYIAISDAIESRLPYASFKNRAGTVVTASVNSVEDALRNADFNGSVINSGGINAYPLVTLTYMIVRLSGMVNCNIATELVRYIAFFYADEKLRNLTISLNMVPIDSEMADFYIESVVQKITCLRVNVWEMMLKQNALVQRQEPVEPWKLPVYVGMSVLIIVVVILMTLFIRQQYKLHSELIHDKWKIASEDITKFKNLSSVSSGNRREAWRSEHLDDLIGTGQFNSQPVILVRLANDNLSTTVKTKRRMLFFRDKVKHRNILHFLGTTYIKQKWYIVHAGETQGSVRDVLDRSNLSISTNGIVALLKDILKGMSYLHREGIVHGNLKGSVCLLDMSWTVRISAWAAQSIANDEIRKHDSENNTADDINQVFWSDSKIMFWRAPELLKKKSKPTIASDVYSFGMVIQEVFTRSDPFSELAMLPQEIVKAIITCSLRPQFNSNTPFSMRPLMERCWGIDPIERPTFQTLLELVDTEFPQQTNILECMIESLRTYAKSLQSVLECKEKEELQLKKKMKHLLYNSAPEHMVQKFIDNQKLDAELFDTASVIVLRISNILYLESRLTSQGAINMLTNFHASLDSALTVDTMSACRIFCYGDELVYGTGIPEPSREHAKDAVKVALEIIAYVEKYNMEHLKGLEAEIQVNVAIASGSFFAGVCGKLVPVFTVIGSPISVARELVQIADGERICLSETTYRLLSTDKRFVMEHVKTEQMVPFYHLLAVESGPLAMR